jgi:hypothetical protein
MRQKQDAQQQTRSKDYKQPKILDWIWASPRGPCKNHGSLAGRSCTPAVPPNCDCTVCTFASNFCATTPSPNPRLKA